MNDNAARDFLLEIGTEELPAAAAREALLQAKDFTRQALKINDLPCDFDAINVWVTPRRIAIFINSLPGVTEAVEVVERGPTVSAAFDEHGSPTKAAHGFARAKNVSVNDLEVREENGKKFVFAIRHQEGIRTVQILRTICLHIMHSIRFSKSMKWDDSGLSFSRPVRWVVLKYGDETFKLNFFNNLSSGDKSRGHRILGPHTITIDKAANYNQLLADNHVIVDQEERRRVILEGLATQAARLGARFIDPAGELEEVLYLVENPSVHSGTFAEDHLRLPDRVLITAMQSHQRYFPLTTEDGALMAGFLYVMNADPAAAPGITAGNERVLEGRIEDAEFSFDQDLKVGIEAMAGRLDTVVFHSRLGSLAAKTARLQRLVAIIADLLQLEDTDRQNAAAAARLAKADQVSVMVQEFSDLEGYMGSVYARLEGYTSDICTAIEEHYLPLFSGGEVPATVTGAVLAIADKVDNLMGAFSVDELPSGSRDPYGLRRAAAGITAISERYGFDFDLKELLVAAHQLLIEQKADINKSAAVVTAALEFILDRIQHRQVEAGTPVEIMEAARAAGPPSLIRLLGLAAAIDSFRREPAFEDLHTAYFRCSKIAAKAGEETGAAIDPALFDESTEKALYETVNRLEPEIQARVQARDYAGALRLAAGIRPVVDAFFGEVMVMAENEGLRRNRLALVSAAARLLLQLGDPIRAAAAPE